jgi:hypothetical protein
MSESTISFVQDLVRQFQELRNLLKEHQEDNFGELLPHVFLGDVTRYVVSLCLENNTRSLRGRKIFLSLNRKRV